MPATPAMAIANNVPHKEDLLDPRIFAVLDEISDDETYKRILYNIPFGLDTQDVLLIASMLNFKYPPTNPQDVAECLGDGKFTVILNALTHELEWESDSTRYYAAVEWFEGDNAFGYTPPDRILVMAMTFDGTHIRHVENPTEEMKLAAVRRTSSAIEYIENPSDAVRQAAATTAIAERAQARSAFLSKYGTGVAQDKALDQNAAPFPVTQDSSANAVQSEPTYFVQGIGSLNYFSGILLSLVIKLNHCAGNDERHSGFMAVTEMDGGLVLSFGVIQQLFLMRDMFLEALEMEGLNGGVGLDFDDLAVIAYPSAVGPGFVTWGPNAAVAQIGKSRSLH